MSAKKRARSDTSDNPEKNITFELKDTLNRPFKFYIPLDKILEKPETMLGRMFDPANKEMLTPVIVDGQPVYQLKANNHFVFVKIVNYYQTNKPPKYETNELYDEQEFDKELDYFNVPKYTRQVEINEFVAKNLKSMIDKLILNVDNNFRLLKTDFVYNFTENKNRQSVKEFNGTSNDGYGYELLKHFKENIKSAVKKNFPESNISIEHMTSSQPTYSIKISNSVNKKNILQYLPDEYK
ncbi:4736_t:CDS:1 [Dentiscutata heterogama]|uniref:4736_t:CDS:1 n=1 Tax=Dentiscutata heterogama TaxID=1316150 RepID=A0ACA9L530_9GLOM|nr:4736_t:CDS:1 [Dentiscutata heterogama]